MEAEIITIGDELLIGQVIDTNSAFIATQLNLCGIKVSRRVAVGDDPADIISSLDDAASRVGVVIMTGGLGPTKDDLTKRVLCNYFNTELRFDEKAFEDIKNLFRHRGKDISDLNRQQAELPESCIPLYNKRGTAPGMWFEKNGKIFISLPGVPYEMEAMIKEQVIGMLQEKFHLSKVFHKTILTTGVPESVLAEKISHWEDALPSYFKLAYLPAPGMVRLRLTAMSGDTEEVNKSAEQQVRSLKQIIGDNIFGYDEERLETVVGALLQGKGLLLSVAESCTGGYLSHLITSVPGSSAYFKGGAVVYSNELKQQLGVSAETIKMYGAVSEATVLELAKSARDVFESDYAISVSGVAGPSGGTEEKPVGLVWIAIATPEKVFAKKFQFVHTRDINIRLSATVALEMLRRELIT